MPLSFLAAQLTQTPNFTFRYADCFQSNHFQLYSNLLKAESSNARSTLPKSLFSGQSHKIFDDKLLLVGMVIGESLLTMKNQERVRMLLEGVCSSSIITNSLQGHTRRSGREMHILPAGQFYLIFKQLRNLTEYSSLGDHVFHGRQCGFN